MEAGVEEKEGRGTRMEGEEPGGVDLEWRSDGDKARRGGWRNFKMTEGRGARDLGRRKRGRRHMAMNKFIVMKPD